MKKKRPLIDGFIPRRMGNQLGQFHSPEMSKKADQEERAVLHTGESKNRMLGEVDESKILGGPEIDESMKEIDEDMGREEKKEKKKLKLPKPTGRKKKIIKRSVITVLIIGLGLGAYLVTKLFLAEGNIFQGSIFDIVQSAPLKEDSNGRSNFLLLGTSEDDPGHGGAYLTDSMMIVSIDQTKKNIYMISIPRDLYVQYGMACNSGYMGKINEYFLCSNGDLDSKTAEQERLVKTQEFVGKIFGVSIQYGVHVNNKVIKEAVDAVGGVDVDIQGSNGAPGVLDRNFDWRCGYTCYLVKYDNGVHHLDGAHALYLAMARGDISPTYGLGNSNFDREKNQQKIIIALK